MSFLSCMIAGVKRLRHEHRVDGVNRRIRQIEPHRDMTTDEINAEPEEAARLLRARQQVREGQIHMGVEDGIRST